MAGKECAMWRVLVGPKNPLSLLRVNNVCEACGGRDLYGEVSKMMFGSGL